MKMCADAVFHVGYLDMSQIAKHLKQHINPTVLPLLAQIVGGLSSAVGLVYAISLP